MQGKVNVLDDHSLAARVGEADLAEFEALAEVAGRGDGVRRGADCWLHGEELEEVFEEYRLFGDVVEAGEDLLNISARTVECAGQEGETAERDQARQGACQDHGVGPVIASGRDHVQGRAHGRATNCKSLIFLKDLSRYLIVM